MINSMYKQEQNLHGSVLLTCLALCYPYEAIADIQPAEAPYADNETAIVTPNDGSVLWQI